jgi:hypothetical protein
MGRPPGRTGGETSWQPAEAPQPILHTLHTSLVDLVIVAQKVQQAVERQNPQLDGQGMPVLARLPSRNS